MMTLSEFKKGRGFKLWTWERRAFSPLGCFNVELHLLDGKRLPPDETMLSLAKELLTYLQDNGEYIQDLVFGSYLACRKRDKAWLALSDVPRKLNRNSLEDYVTNCALVVQRDTSEPEYPHRSFVYLCPQWDEEHGMSMEFKDGKIVNVNDLAFELKDGLLELKYEG
jgi:hypothetical protein